MTSFNAEGDVYSGSHVVIGRVTFSTAEVAELLRCSAGSRECQYCVGLNLVHAHA
jgi:hypothetical protein